VRVVFAQTSGVSSSLVDRLEPRRVRGRLWRGLSGDGWRSIRMFGVGGVRGDGSPRSWTMSRVAEGHTAAAAACR